LFFRRRRFRMSAGAWILSLTAFTMDAGSGC
jgi:hypothetical protein